MTVTTIYLVRHGQTDNNLPPYRLQGRSDSLLNTTGYRQAEKVADYFSKLALPRRAICYTSPLARAVDTADFIATAAGVVDAFTEVDVGEWEGLTWEEATQRDPDAVRSFSLWPDLYPYKGGENYQQVAHRSGAALRELAKQYPGEHVIVVTHNVVIRVLAALALDIDLRNARNIHIDNCSITQFLFDGKRYSLKYLNSIQHLEE